VLGAGAGSVLAVPQYAGPVTFAVWALTTLTPTLLTWAQGRAFACQRYMLGSAVAWALVVLHPSRSFRSQRRRVSAVRLLARGDVAGAIRALEEFGRGGPVQGIEARIEIARLRRDGDEIYRLLDVLDATGRPPPPTVALSMLRALAELADGPALFAAYRRFELALEGPAAMPLRTAAYLALLADAGRPADVEALFGARLASTTPEIRRLWLAVARRSAGDATTDRDLDDLARARDGLVRRAAELRRAIPVGREPLPAVDVQLCDAVARRVEIEDTYLFGATVIRPAWITHAMVALILLVFVLEELLGGSTDPGVLDRLGALSPRAVLEGGEWWRVVTPMFLHYGPVHLAFNVLGLYVLGPFAERALGRERYLLVYLGSGVSVGLLAVARGALPGADDAVLVGASGAIMGVVGATVAVLMHGAFRERVVLARKRLYLLFVVLALQVLFDFLVPNVSFFAHSVGALTGFLLGRVSLRSRG
jgi:rhomboid protease GluP